MQGSRQAQARVPSSQLALRFGRQSRFAAVEAYRVAVRGRVAVHGQVVVQDQVAVRDPSAGAGYTRPAVAVVASRGIAVPAAARTWPAAAGTACSGLGGRQVVAGL